MSDLLKVDKSVEELLGYDYAYVTACLNASARKPSNEEMTQIEYYLNVYSDIIDKLSFLTVPVFLKKKKYLKELNEAKGAFDYFGLEDFYHRIVTDTHGLDFGMKRSTQKAKKFSDISFSEDSTKAMSKIAPLLVPVFGEPSDR